MAKSKKSKSGLSRSVRRFTVIEDRPGSSTSTRVQSTLVRQQDLVREREESLHRQKLAFSGLSSRAVEQIRELHARTGSSGDATTSTMLDDSSQALQDLGDAMDVDAGEYEDEDGDMNEDVLHALRDFLGDRWKKAKVQGARTWRQRLEKVDTNWSTILEQLTDAYLTWRYPLSDSSPSTFNTPKCPLGVHSPPSSIPRPPSTNPEPTGAPPPHQPGGSLEQPHLHTPHHAEGSGLAPCAADTPRSAPYVPDGSREQPEHDTPRHAEGSREQPEQHTPRRAEGSEGLTADLRPPPQQTRPSGASATRDAPPPARDSTYDFNIDVVDMYGLARTATIQRDATDTTVIAMASQGYLATTPISPSLAITFNTLEHFRLLRLRKPSFSIEAFAKVLCDSYAIPYRRRYRVALSDSFDIYLAILRVIENRVKLALNRDTADWRVQNSCPACCYELEDEVPLIFSRIFCFDGNNSLKRVAKFGDREVADQREFTESDYYLSSTFVDEYKDEVKGGPAVPEQPSDDLGAKEADDAPLDHCTRNWKAAARDEDKKMWGMFDESGIFASACRHGFILWVADMIRSGELAKYPLAIVAKALKVLGPRLLIGYDIGCSFCGTIDRSSLGTQFRQLMCRCCVDAFHGYSHSHRCQTQHHPSIIEGAGIEDMGVMERLFSSSNQLATITRYASRFHRCAIIDMFLKQWDEDKYANLATMLLNNYRQALKIIEDDDAAVEDALRELKRTPADLANWQAEEAAYFASVGTEDPANATAVEYVVLLRELRSVQSQLANSAATFVTSIPEDWTFGTPPAASTSASANRAYHTETSQTRKKETERRHLGEKWDRLSREVIAMELKMGINRWAPESHEYKATLKYIAERDYQVALEKLHGLVVQRLFELHSMNISQTAYKVRTYIAKNLQRRSEAIRTAVKQYNDAAHSIDPPRPELDWTKVTHYTFLDEFELLRDTRNDIRKKPWTQPLAREAMKKSRRVLRAREELVRCNAEVRRLHTSILDENHMLDAAVCDARSRGDAISGPLELFSIRRRRVNTRLLAVISQIHALDGFTGNKTPGRRKGATQTQDGTALSVGTDLQAELEEMTRNEDATMDDAEMSDMARLVEFTVNIS